MCFSKEIFLVYIFMSQQLLPGNAKNMLNLWLFVKILFTGLLELKHNPAWIHKVRYTIERWTDDPLWQGKKYKIYGQGLVTY